MTISTIEHYLSYHIRLLSPHILSNKVSNKLAYLFSLLAALTSGFISLISLYTQPWHIHSGYSSWQINTIASMTTLGMYLTPPVLGIIADLHGPITLNFIAILGFIPCYSYLAYNFEHHELSETDSSFHMVLICFVIIGVATSASYFSALLTCAKLYPRKKLLSISLPTTCFGLSSLIGSQIVRIDWFWFKHHNYLNLTKVFKCLSVIYLLVGFLAWFSTAMVTLMHHHDVHEEDEIQLLLSNVGSIQSQKEKKFNQKKFFKDPITYVFALSMLLALGPLEMFVTNMASLSDLLTFKVPSRNLSNQLLSSYSFFSTFTRLFIGVVTDFLTERKISTKWILLSFLSICLGSQVFIKYLTNTSDGYTELGLIITMGSLSGVVYGGLFTIYPTIILIVYGQELFGTVYGTMMVAPALGSTISYILYAKIYDSDCSSELPVSSCISPVYQTIIYQIIFAIILTIITLRTWRKRNAPI